MRADYSRLLFALSFLLLSIFATYCPILSLFSCVKAAERREALCAEGQYYDSGPGKCQTCDIPCKTSEQVCRDLGCSDYYNIKSKKELCKQDEYYEKTLEKCRPCSIPCSMSAEQCQQMGCTISSSLPTSDLPPTATPPDTRVSPIFAKTTAAPDKTDPPKFSMGAVIGCSIIASLVVTGLTGLFVFLGNYLHAKYINKDRNELTPRQKRVLGILEICHRTYERIVPSNTPSGKDQSGADDGGPRPDHPLIPQGPPAVPGGDPRNQEQTQSTTPTVGANPAENGSTMAADVSNNSQRFFSLPAIQLDTLRYIDDEDYAGNDQNDAATANVNGPPSDNQLHYEDITDGHPVNLTQTQDATPAKGVNHRPSEDTDLPSKGATPAAVAIPVEDPTPATISQENAEQSRLNAELGNLLYEGISKEQFKRLKTNLKGPHGISNVRAIDDAEFVYDLIDLLKRKKKIRINEPDGYGLLIKVLNDIDEKKLADLVKKYQLSIYNAGLTTSGAA